jgi:hypothetical protein
MECAVRGEPETDRSMHGVKVGAVIGGGVQRFPSLPSCREAPAPQ